jgi:hypothetical protein
MSFEEMQPFVIHQEPIDSALTGEPSDLQIDEGDNEAEANSAS